MCAMTPRTPAQKAPAECSNAVQDMELTSANML